MNNIIHPEGWYLTTMFRTRVEEPSEGYEPEPQRTYRLIGTRSNNDPKLWRAMQSVDTFILVGSNPSEYRDMLRGQVFERAELGEIII